MIKALELENFKAFGKRTRIQFAPITLIYGQNSAGKSSVLNALSLLKQTRESRDQGALLLPRAEGGFVDLGSFHELLHEHDSTRTLAIRVDLDVVLPRRRVSREPEQEPGIVGFEVGFRREDEQSDVSLAYMQAYVAGVDVQPVLRFEPTKLAASEQRALLRYFPYVAWRGNRQISPHDLKAASCVDITAAEEFWSTNYANARESSADIVRALESMRGEIMGKPTGQMRLFRDIELHEEDFAEAIAFYSSSFTLEEFIARRRKAELGGVVAMDGFLPMPARGDSRSSYPEVHAVRFARDNRIARTRMFDANEFIIYAGRTLETELDRLFPLGPYRRAPERLYIFTGTTPCDVGYSGNLLPDLLFRRRGLIDETNGWLDRLDVGYHVNINPVGTRSADLFEVRLVDTRRKSSASVALPDVGFGISQILPFIVQTLASEEQTITIEQPEVHIHPKLQADLADLLIAGIQAPRNHRFIIETHSEHLLLRLLRRIRETHEATLPEGQQGLNADQLSVVYVERGLTGADVHHLRIDESGEFIDRWPQGFFEERARELF